MARIKELAITFQGTSNIDKDILIDPYDGDITPGTETIITPGGGGGSVESLGLDKPW